ncbi:MAG: YceD family protein [Ignavibacteria bacterium]
MILNIASLKEGEHFVEFLEKPSVFNLSEIEFLSDVYVKVKVVKTYHQIDLEVSFECLLKFLCDRCLDPFEYKLQNTFELVYKFDFTRRQGLSYKFERYVDSVEKEELKDDNFKVISEHTKDLDITNDLRDYILLSLPMRRVPDEIDGVCSVCHRTLDEIFDSRVLIKKSFKSDLEKTIKIIKKSK